MSNKRKRVASLASLKRSIGDIGYDAENQTPEIIKSNMEVLGRHVEEILKLDGFGFISNDKVREYKPTN